MIRELGSYVYDERRNERGQNLPKDTDNHLCDALRYAFYDVKFFRPEKQKIIQETVSNISGTDFNGGWDT